MTRSGIAAFIVLIAAGACSNMQAEDAAINHSKRIPTLSPSQKLPTYFLSCPDADKKDFFQSMDEIFANAKSNALPTGLTLTLTYQPRDPQSAALTLSASDQGNAPSFIQAIYELSKPSKNLKFNEKNISVLTSVDEIGTSLGFSDDFSAEYNATQAFAANPYRGLSVSINGQNLDIGNSILAAVLSSQKVFAPARMQKCLLESKCQSKIGYVFDPTKIRVQGALLEEILKGMNDPQLPIPADFADLLKQVKDAQVYP